VKGRAGLINLAVALGSLLFGLFVGEGAVRIALNPANYLSVEMRDDPILGAKPMAGTAGGAFDAWGFRNSMVPASAQIVAIGDSHTYGNTATMAQAWPAVLGKVSGRSVYNMGLGGYGPNQYTHLLSQALTLKPELVVVGLYMGDDFENAFRITYGLDHWAPLRALAADKVVNFDIWGTRQAAWPWHKRLRVWLSRHSVLYQLVFHGPLLGRLQGETQIRHASSLSPDVTTLAVADKGILEAFRPKGLLVNLDQTSAGVNEGMRISFELLLQMKQACDAKNVGFVVAIIPTKEMVFADLLEPRADLPLASTIVRLLAQERKARDLSFERLRQSGITFVDVLPNLRAARDKQLYARTPNDMHPNGNGYRVIGETIATSLRPPEVLKP
jgi:hypothetical protein